MTESEIEKGVQAMIREMAKAFTRVMGVEPTREQQQQVEFEVRQEFAGERIYVAAWPKQKRQRQLAQANKKLQRDIATVAGISERHARRILRGK